MGVTVLSVLYGIGAVLMFLGALAFFAGGALLTDGAGIFAGIAMAVGVLYLILAVAAAAVAYGLWTRQRWAWYTALVLAGVSLLLNVITLLSGEVIGSVLGLIIAGVVIWYLLKPDVQSWFGVRHETPWGSGQTA